MLSTEELFNIKKFSFNVEKMSEEQTKAHLVELFEQMIVMDNYYKEAIAKNWGIEHK